MESEGEGWTMCVDEISDSRFKYVVKEQNVP